MKNILVFGREEELKKLQLINEAHVFEVQDDSDLEDAKIVLEKNMINSVIVDLTHVGIRLKAFINELKIAYPKLNITYIENSKKLNK